jgi:hypothetical protein
MSDIKYMCNAILGPLIIQKKVWLVVGDFCPDRHHQIWSRFVQIFKQASIILPNFARPQDWPPKKAVKWFEK